MTTNQKLLVALLLVATFLLWAGVFAFRYIRSKSATVNNTIPVAKDASDQIKKEYGNIDSKDASIYVSNVLKPKYQPDKNLFNKVGYLTNTNEGYIKLSTNEWVVDDNLLYAEIFKSIKGKNYSQSNLPLDYDVYVKRIINPPQSIADLFPNLKNYFVIPDTVNLSTAVEFPVKLRGKAREVTWKNADGTLESRSVWDLQDGNTFYFIACRIFPNSPFYAKNTCYYVRKT